jgi:Leucine-rich repeat (LRR) protein
MALAFTFFLLVVSGVSSTLIQDFSNSSLSSISAVQAAIHPNVTELRLDLNQLSALGANALNGYSLLTKVSVSQNQLTTVSSTAFTGCPLVELDLSYNALSSFPPLSTVASTLQSLTITSNAFTRIYSSNVQDLSLTTLIALNTKFEEGFDFLYNLKSTLVTLQVNFVYGVSFDFASMPELKFLTLTSGSFHSEPVSDDNFAQSSLYYLNLNLMNLTEFPWFPGLGQTLFNLVLSRNSFSEPIDPTCFENLEVVKKLTMADCDLESFPNVSSLYNTLERLSLEDNQISEVPDGMFSDFNHLKELNLQGNPLGSIPDLGSLAQRISTLNFQKIGLVNLTCNDLAPFENLTLLNLDHNQIFDTKVFDCLPSPLTELDLGYNHISDLDWKNWPFLTTLRELDLSGNPLHQLCEVSIFCEFYTDVLFCLLSKLLLSFTSIISVCFNRPFALPMRNAFYARFILKTWKCTIF